MLLCEVYTVVWEGSVLDPKDTKAVTSSHNKFKCVWKEGEISGLLHITLLTVTRVSTYCNTKIPQSEELSCNGI